MKRPNPVIVRHVRKQKAIFSIDMGETGLLHPAHGQVIATYKAARPLTLAQLTKMRETVHALTDQAPEPVMRQWQAPGAPHYPTMIWGAIGARCARWGAQRDLPERAKIRLCRQFSRISKALDYRAGYSPQDVGAGVIAALIDGSGDGPKGRADLRDAFEALLEQYAWERVHVRHYH